MTVEELNILISASAEEATSQLDAVILKVATLAQMADGNMSALDIKLDTTAAVQQAAALGGVMEAAGDAAQASMAKAQQGAEALAPAMQKAADVSEPIRQATEGLKAAGTAAEAAGKSVAKSLDTGNVAAKEFSGTIKAMGSGLLQGLVSGGTQALVTLAVGGVIKLVDALANAKENAEKAAEEMRQQHRETATAMEQERARLNELAASYTALANKPNRSLAETQEMYTIQAQLRSEFGITAGAVDGLAGSYTDLAAAIKAAQEAQAGQSAEALKAVAMDAGNQALKKSAELYKELAERKAMLLDVEQSLAAATRDGDAANIELFSVERDAILAGIEATQSNLSAASIDFMHWFGALNKENAAQIEAAGREWNEGIAQALAAAFEIKPEEFASDADIGKFVTEAANAIMQAATSTVAQDALTAAQDFHTKLMEGWVPTEADYEQVTESYDVLRETIAQALTDITGEVVDADADAVSEVLARYAPPESLAKDWEDFSDVMNQATIVSADGFDYLNASAKDWNDQQDKLIRQSKTLTDRYAEGKRQLDVYEKGMAAVQKAQKAGAKLTADDEKALSDLRKEVKYSGDSMEVLAQVTRNAAAKTKAELDGTSDKAYALRTEFGNVQASADIRGDVQVNTDAASAALASLKAIALGVLAVLSALGVVSGQTDAAPKSGGGGGGKKDDPEAAAREAERLRQEAIEADYRRIENKRHLNQISLEEELAMLEELRQRHRLNAEEIMEWEERIYDLKREIADRDTEAIDNLSDGIIEALENRYEAMRDAELARLEESKKGWEDWRDSNVAAIQAQIDALDELTETEDREAAKAEKLRKIANLEQQLAYEQDAYNRAKLQQQLDAARKSYDDLVKKYDRADQKDALRDQMEEVEKQADREIDKIDQQQEEIERLYDERLKDAALRAEAEKILMTNTQQQIIDLIAAYAPDYNATGETLGEQLYQGFMHRVGNITQWFENFNHAVEALQNAAAADAQAAADAMYRQHQTTQTASAQMTPTVVYQTVNYNQPVETPSQAARRLAEANEALAGQLMGAL